MKKSTTTALPLLPAGVAPYHVAAFEAVAPRHKVTTERTAPELLARGVTDPYRFVHSNSMFALFRDGFEAGVASVEGVAELQAALARASALLQQAMAEQPKDGPLAKEMRNFLALHPAGSLKAPAPREAIRAAALEEAAQICQQSYESGQGGAGCEAAAATIRARKDAAVSASACPPGPFVHEDDVLQYAGQRVGERLHAALADILGKKPAKELDVLEAAAKLLRQHDKLKVLKDNTVSHGIAVGAVCEALALAGNRSLTTQTGGSIAKDKEFRQLSLAFFDTIASSAPAAQVKKAFSSLVARIDTFARQYADDAGA